MIDYLTGRRVVGISAPLHKSDWTWAIELEDGIKIVHTGQNKRPGNVIEGSVLGTAVEDGSKTRLGFYRGANAELAEAVAVPSKTIEVRYPEGQEPPLGRLTDPSVDLPDDPSPKRIVGGPLDER